MRENNHNKHNKAQRSEQVRRGSRCTSRQFTLWGVCRLVYTSFLSLLGTVLINLKNVHDNCTLNLKWRTTFEKEGLPILDDHYHPQNIQNLQVIDIKKVTLKIALSQCIMNIKFIDFIKTY